MARLVIGVLLIPLVALLLRRISARKRMEREWDQEMQRRTVKRIAERTRSHLSERGASVREALIAVPVVLLLLLVAALFVFQRAAGAP